MTPGREVSKAWDIFRILFGVYVSGYRRIYLALGILFALCAITPDPHSRLTDICQGLMAVSWLWNWRKSLEEPRS